jgi:hypothetical protein
LVALIAAFIWYSGIPSDSRIQKQFTRDKVVITELLDKLSKESPNIVGITKDDVMVDDPSNWVLPEKAGFSEKHFAEYKALMDDAHIINFWRSNGETDFAIAGFGFASEGWRLGFTYTTLTPSPLVTSIDSPPRLTTQDRGEVYRPLGDNCT